jgi:hypothetical protein
MKILHPFRCSSAICILAAIGFEKISCVGGLVGNSRPCPNGIANAARNHYCGGAAPSTRLFVASPKHQEKQSSDSFRREDAVKAIRSCAIMAFISGLLDAALTIAPMLVQPSKTQFSVALLPKTLWKFGFAVCLMRLVPRYESLNSLYTTTEQDEKLLAQLVQTMARFWRANAWVLAATTTVDVVSCFSDHRHRIIALQALIAVIASSSLVIRVVSARQTTVLSQDHTESLVRRVGHRYIRNMAFCTAALIGKGCAAAVLLAVSKGQRKLFGLIGLPTPFVTAGLLWRLRSTVMDAILEATNAAKTDETTFSKLYYAQTKFYRRVESILKREIQSKCVVALAYVAKTLWLPLQMHARVSSFMKWSRVQK